LNSTKIKVNDINLRFSNSRSQIIKNNLKEAEEEEGEEEEEENRKEP